MGYSGGRRAAAAVAIVGAVTLSVDGMRLSGRLDELGEIGAIEGPNGERGCARLALTDRGTA